MDSGNARGGGHTLQVARKKCIAKSCIFVKNSNTGQRITRSRCDFIRRGGDLCLCMDAINAVEKTGGGVLNRCFGREVRPGRSNPDPV